MLRVEGRHVASCGTKAFEPWYAGTAIPQVADKVHCCHVTNYSAGLSDTVRIRVLVLEGEEWLNRLRVRSSRLSRTVNEYRTREVSCCGPRQVITHSFRFISSTEIPVAQNAVESISRL